MNHNEYNLQKQICQYLDIQYHGILYLSDTVASVRLTMGQAMRNKAIQKSGFSCPDLIILQPNKLYKGLFIELKIKTPFKKNGELLRNAHLERQKTAIDKLNNLGYFATFSTGFEETKKIIDKYMSLIE